MLICPPIRTCTSLRSGNITEQTLWQPLPSGRRYRAGYITRHKKSFFSQAIILMNISRMVSETTTVAFKTACHILMNNTVLCTYSMLLFIVVCSTKLLNGFILQCAKPGIAPVLESQSKQQYVWQTTPAV